MAGWLEDLWPQLLSFTQRKLMRALATHYDPEDVLQDSVYRAWRNPENTRHLIGAQSFERWMKRVITNRVMDLRRMVSVRERVWPSSASGADEAGEQWDRLERLPDRSKPEGGSGLTARQGSGDGAARQIRFLPFDEQLCLLMRDVMRVDWGSVAATLQRSTNGAKSLRHRARGRII